MNKIKHFMYRKLKFRAFDIKERHWVPNIGFGIGGESNVLAPAEQTRIHIMQFIDAFDFYKNALYEGDIVFDRSKEKVLVIIFKNSKFAGVTVEDFNRIQKALPESIDDITYYTTFQKQNQNLILDGNIYDNPELL